MSSLKSLDFIQPKLGLPNWTWVGLLVLGFGSVFLWNVWRNVEQIQAQDNLVQQEIQALNKAKVRFKKSDTTLVKSINPNQKLALTTSVRELQVTWDALFSALEKASNQDVTLLSLQPDSKKQQVIIVGEAKDYPTILVYMDGLAKQAMLSNVYLQRHAVNEADKDKPVRFTIYAHWNAIDKAVAL